MSPEETKAFKLLDQFARSEHHCFLAEFFPNEDGNEYILCFRPTGVTKDDPDRYACKYIHIPADEVHTISAAKSLSPELAADLSAELQPLTRPLTENR